MFDYLHKSLQRALRGVEKCHQLTMQQTPLLSLRDPVPRRQGPAGTH